MTEWTSTARANATAEQLLEVLTRPEEIRRWSPVDFDIDDLDGRRLAAGTRGRVTGRLAGVRVGFDVEIHVADQARLELSAQGPIGLHVRYELAADDAGSSLNASVSMRPSRGLTGRLVANATAALLSAGVLDGATGRIARVAESLPLAAAA
ncbi:MAG: SRPBCC family protein [Thermoleophilaceae bacterium]|nr:SRPBCC family protein [Thermoleophilaceae bacterium]